MILKMNLHFLEVTRISFVCMNTFINDTNFTNGDKCSGDNGDFVTSKIP